MSRVQKIFEKPSLTKQAFKDECDVNRIVARFCQQNPGRNFLVDYAGFVNGQYGDFSDIPDYRTARDLIIAAQAKFEALPAVLRERFGNDAANFVDFALDPKNLDQMRQMGLANPEKVDSQSDLSSKAIEGN